MVDLIAINKSFSGRKFQKEILLFSQKEKSFLVLLAPMMDYLYQEIISFRGEFCDPVFNSILNDFVNIFVSPIGRICLFEMNKLKKSYQLIGDSPESRFEYFISFLMQVENREMIFKEYPVLRDRVETFSENYLVAKKTLLQRFYKDLPSIAVNFFKKNVKEDAVELLDIRTVGDYHARANAVSIVTLKLQGNTVKVIYKPRSLQMMKVYKCFLTWIKLQFNLSLYVPAFIDKGLYGWVEYIDYHSCSAEADVCAYYYRLGLLGAIMHFLGGRDLHAENIIARDNKPYAIDLECLCSASIDRVGGGALENTLILPIKRIKTDWAHKEFDYSAYGHGMNLRSFLPYIAWKEAGTDNMKIVKKHRIKSDCANVPKLNGSKVNPANYHEDFIVGYKVAYFFCLKHKNQILQEFGLFKQFGDIKVRVLFRPTAFYTKLIEESFHPKLLSNFAQLETYLNKLRLTFPNISDAEIRDIYRLDVPYFSAPTDKKLVFDSENDLLKQQLIRSGLKNLSLVWSDLSETNYLKHEKMIRESFL